MRWQAEEVAAVLGERGSVTEGVQGGREGGEGGRESERGQVMRGRLCGEVVVSAGCVVRWWCWWRNW